MLVKLYQDGLVDDMDLNCAETVFYICKEYYKMDISPSAMSLSAAFGGGMCIEDTCGALTGGLMALGYLFVNEGSHKSTIINQIVTEFFIMYGTKMGAINCQVLKEQYKTEETGCQKVIETSLECLDEIISKYTDDRIR